MAKVGKYNRKPRFVLILLLALFVGIAWGVNSRSAGGRQPDYTMFSRGEHGVSLLYDTLRHMGAFAVMICASAI